MADRKRILTTAAFVMVGMAVVGTVAGTAFLYRSALETKRADLRALARREAQIIEAILGYGSDEHGPADHSDPDAIKACPKCSLKVALVKHALREAGNLQSDWGEGVEFVIGSREGSIIRFLLPSKHVEPGGPEAPRAVPWESALAEPMRLALSGLSGTIEAEDYRGVVVLAAYAPVNTLQWGVVAKIDMAEMRAPFVTAARNSLALAILAIVLGLIVLTKRLNPLIQRLQDSEEQAKAALAELRNQKRAMDEHSIIAVTDPSGKITYANDKFCQVSQYSREELIGRDHRIVNSGRHPRAFFADMWRTITSGNVWHGEVCNRAKDGSLYWVSTTIAPFKDEAGRITQYVAIRTDTTERTRFEEELRKAKIAAEAADLAKSEFLANMSHEIRTPMTAILGFAETIAENVVRPGNVDAIATIRRNGEYLLGIINDILDLSKIEAGKLVVEELACNPCQVIADVASLLRVRADAKCLALNIEYIGAIPETIVSDPTRLRQILINLVGNAIKFTDKGAVTLITRFVGDAGNNRDASSTESCLRFDVVDTGPGITEEQAAALFRPFTQADTSTTRKFGGTGLGLTISKKFAEMLGGDISLIESEVGVGTRFRVTVATGPLDGVRMLEDPMSATVVAATAGEDTQDSRSDLSGCRILLAEDGLDNQRLISFVLKKAGADVTVKENGKLALDVAIAARDDGNPFDCILMDMQMPVMDGYQATNQLRRSGYTGPIIALTAHAMASDRGKCVKAGCDDYSTKPIDRKKLIKTIRQHLLPADHASSAAT